MLNTGFLIADPRDEARLMEASSAVVLVGSYDGSANFGDVLQARIALDRLAADGGSSVVAIVIEDEYADYSIDVLAPPPGTVVLRFTDIDPGRAALTQLPELTTAYLYGGGYLNAAWGPRKLQHLETVDRLVRANGAAGLSRVVVTGVQVTPFDDLWRWKGWLDGSQLLAVRDQESIEVLVDLGVDRRQISDYGDDATEALLDAETEILPGPCVNVHVNLESYVTNDASARVERVCSILAQIASTTPGLRCRLLVAFDDPRIDERRSAAAVERRYTDLVETGDAPPLTFEVVSLIEALRRHEPIVLGGLATVTSSYHVGMMSLLYGIPTVLLVDNDFYAQKMRALADIFGVGERAVLSTDMAASEVTACLAACAADLSVHHARSMTALRMRQEAARLALRHAARTLERDVLWAQAQSIYPFHRVVVEQLSELYERKRNVDLLADARLELVEQADAAITELHAHVERLTARVLELEHEQAAVRTPDRRRSARPQR